MRTTGWLLHTVTAGVIPLSLTIGLHAWAETTAPSPLPKTMQITPPAVQPATETRQSAAETTQPVQLQQLDALKTKPDTPDTIVTPNSNNTPATEKPAAPEEAIANKTTAASQTSTEPVKKPTKTPKQQAPEKSGEKKSHKPAATPKTDTSKHPPNAAAETSAVAKLLSARVEPRTGNIVFQGEGAALLPVLTTEKTGDGGAKITFELKSTGLDTEQPIDSAVLLNDLKAVFPEVQTLTLSPGQNDNLLMVIETRAINGLQPTIHANTGSLVTLALKEESVTPPTEITQTPNKPASSDAPALGFYQWFVPLPDGAPPQPLDGLVRQAWLDYANNNVSSTVFTLKSYLDHIPDDYAARYLLTLGYQRLGDYTSAEKELKTLVVQQPNWLAPQLDLIRVKLHNKTDAGKSDPEFDKLLQEMKIKWPDHPDVKLAMAGLSAKRQQWEDARKMLLELTSQHSGNLMYDDALADLELKTNHPEAARAVYLRMLALDPKNATANQALADLAVKAGQTDLAQKYYENALSPQALLAFAALLQKNNHTAESLAVLKTAEASLTGDVLKKDDSTREMLYTMGMMFANLKDSNAAQKTLQAFVDMAAGQPASSNDHRIADAKSTLQKLSSQTGGASAAKSVK